MPAGINDKVFEAVLNYTFDQIAFKIEFLINNDYIFTFIITKISNYSSILSS